MVVRFALPAAIAALTLAAAAPTSAVRSPQAAAPPAPAVQTAPVPQGRGAAPGQGRGRGGRATFPAQQRALAEPEVIDRGRAVYSVTCTACHGGDLRGGQTGGPNLLRSPIVLSDDVADQLVPILEGSRADRGMPPVSLPAEDVRALGAYLHSVVATMRGQGSPPDGPPVQLNIVVGDAKAGAAYFTRNCSTCHAADGDLRGIASRVSEPRMLQNLWVAGRGRGANPASTRRTVTAVVTEPSGARTEGRLVRYDDFAVTLELADGRVRTFRRDGDVPALEINDPLAGHGRLLPGYTNKDMHDVTAFLVTLK